MNIKWDKWREFSSILFEEESNVQVEKKVIKFPRLVITDKWGIPDSEDRKYISQFFSPIAKGKDLAGKIRACNLFITECSSETCIVKRSVREILSKIVFLETLCSLVTETSAVSAGFLYESLMAVLLDTEEGKQVPALGNPGLDDIVVKGEPVSLKLLAYENGLVKGSIENLKSHEIPLKYIVTLKETKDDIKLHFYQFFVSYAKHEGADFWLNDGKMNRRDTQFFINKKHFVKDEFFVGTLNLGSKEKITELAKRYIEKLGTSLFDVFEYMENLNIQINDYFLSNRKSSGMEAKQTAALLKKTVDEEF
jgi:hypothetical protein